MTGTTIDWALWIGAGVLASGALLLFAWALFADRSRGRKRCPKCWYPMDSIAAAEGLHCPECGTAIADEKSLLRTRRRWRLAAVAMPLGVVAYALSLTPRVIHGGWPSAIPSTILVSVWPVSIKDWVAEHFDMQVAKDPVITELDERLKESKLSGWQASMWRGRVESYFRKQGRLGIAAEEKVLQKLAKARLTQKIETQPLKDVLQLYEQELGVPIVAEWSVLDAEQLVPDMTVTLTHTSASGFDVLDDLLRAVGVNAVSAVQWRVEGNKVVLGVWNPSLTVLPVCSYELARPIIRHEPIWIMGYDDQWTEYSTMDDRLASMRQVMTSYVEPEMWLEGGGEMGAAALIDTRALVRAPARAHARIGSLFDAIDAAWEKGGAVSAEPDDDWDEMERLHAKLRDTVVNMPAGPVRVETLIETLSVVCGVTFDADWASLASVRVVPELNVDIVAAELTAAQALDRYISRLVPDSLDGVSWTIHAGAVRIGARSAVDARMVNRVYNVLDLLPPLDSFSKASNDDGSDKGQSPVLEVAPMDLVVDGCADLQRVVTHTVDPEGWIDGGGESGWIRALGPLLVVKSNARNHFAIESLLAKLRRAKGSGSTPPTGHADDWDEIAQSYSMLKQTTLKMPDGSITLDVLAESINTMCGVPVDIDWQGLAQEGVDREHPIKMEGANVTAVQALDRCTSVLAPHSQSRIGWTIIAGLVQIGPRQSIESHQVTRVYDTIALRGCHRIPERNAEGRSPISDDTDYSLRGLNDRTTMGLRSAILQSVDPDGWTDTGGESGTFCSLGSLLIITTTPNNHFAIDELIAKLLAAKDEPAAAGGDQ